MNLKSSFGLLNGLTKLYIETKSTLRVLYPKKKVETFKIILDYCLFGFKNKGYNNVINDVHNKLKEFQGHEFE